MTDEELIRAAVEHARRDGLEVTEAEARQRLSFLRQNGMIDSGGQATQRGDHVLERRRVLARMSGGHWPSKIT